MTSAVTVAQGGNSNYTFRNRIINGAIGIWQRGTSFTSGGTGTYTADRFYGNGSSGTISRSTDVPAGFTYSFSNAPSSTAFPGISQRIESVNIADLASQTITASFWVKQTSGTASALNINLAYPSVVDNWGSSTTIVETNVVASPMPASWTRYTFTYTLPSNVTNGMSITLFIPSASVTATFLITGIQLEAGSTVTPFENRPYGTELALCQRYYQKSYNRTDVPGTTTSTGEIRFQTAGTGGESFPPVVLPVPMRTTPSLVFYSPNSGASGAFYNYSAGTNPTMTGTNNNGERGWSGGPGASATSICGYHYTASAEL
jgi:hypothetical protein